VEREFCELRLLGILGSSLPTPKKFLKTTKQCQKESPRPSEFIADSSLTGKKAGMSSESDAKEDFVFIRHLDDSDEFYNLATDEFQLESKPGLITADMHSKLDRLTRLNADNLRAVEQEA
jgi:hypothetical protein